MTRPLLVRAILATTLLALCLPACKKKDDEESVDLTLRAIPISRETRSEDGLIVRTYDDNNDGLSEITKYFEEIPDPDDPSTLIRRLKRMELDVNSDGRLNVVRFYGLTGKLESERLDQDLDGIIDVVSYYDRGQLAKKEVLKPNSEVVDYVRYYANDQLLRVEKDTTGDGKIDYWEFYERGILERIGRDFNADGRADSWQTR